MAAAQSVPHLQQHGGKEGDGVAVSVHLTSPLLEVQASSVPHTLQIDDLVWQQCVCRCIYVLYSIKRVLRALFLMDCKQKSFSRARCNDAVITSLVYNSIFLWNSQDIGVITRTLHAAQRLADLVGGRGVHVARKKAHVGHLQCVTTFV